MSFEFFIASRYLRVKKKQPFIALITVLSIAGVMVGVMALIVVIAVMSGFESDLKARILAGQSHVVVMRHGGPFTEYRKVIENMVSIEEVLSSRFGLEPEPNSAKFDFKEYAFGKVVFNSLYN